MKEKLGRHDIQYDGTRINHTFHLCCLSQFSKLFNDALTSVTLSSVIMLRVAMLIVNMEGFVISYYADCC